MTTPFDSRVIANRIVDIANAKGMKLTMMQLLKLVYISHGWWLTFSNGKPLTADKPQAWQYGPVHPLVYRAFRSAGANGITQKAVDPISGFEFSADIPDEVNSILDQVVTSYGPIHAYRLSDMTHQEGTPWSRTIKNFKKYAPISDALIKEHFDELRRKRH